MEGDKARTVAASTTSEIELIRLSQPAAVRRVSR
jgi:hypothetical protein